jgi:hypothetical protein
MLVFSASLPILDYWRGREDKGKTKGPGEGRDGETDVPSA